MHDISVIGLGLMGAALARNLKRAGHNLIVWNRSASRLKPFRDEGIPCAQDLRSAVLASEIILVCIDNYASTRAMLDTPEISPLLRGKTIVQLSSGTPKEASEASDWVHGHGAAYLDGAILAGPSSIGTDRAKILLSGDEDACARSIRMLECLGQQTVRFLGSTVGAASALDLAWLMASYGNFITAIHAANLCKSEGVEVEEFIALVPHNPPLQRNAKVIQDESYDDFTASLRVWGEALEHIRQQGRDAGINTEIPDFIGGLFERAMAEGHAETNVMSLVKILR